MGLLENVMYKRVEHGNIARDKDADMQRAGMRDNDSNMRKCSSRRCYYSSAAVGNRCETIANHGALGAEPAELLVDTNRLG